MSKKKSKTITKRPPASPENQNHAQLAKLTQQQFSGPVPHPDILHGYDQIIPGAAERILIMAEKDAAHQREIESAVLNLTAADVKRGQRFGFGIGILAFTTCILALALGSEKTAITIGSTTVIGLVTVFVTGRVTQPK